MEGVFLSLTERHHRFNDVCSPKKRPVCEVWRSSSFRNQGELVCLGFHKTFQIFPSEKFSCHYRLRTCSTDSFSFFPPHLGLCILSFVPAIPSVSCCVCMSQAWGCQGCAQAQMCQPWETSGIPPASFSVLQNGRMSLCCSP